MSAVHVPDRASLEELRCRFNKAAFEFPDVDAVVVKLPDLRHEETVRQAREYLGRLMHSRLVKTGEPESFTVREVIESANCLHEATRWAVQLDTWIPPVHQSIEQQGGQLYYVHTDCELIQQTSGKSGFRHLWHCALFGPPAGAFGNTALRLFNLLAPDAARLILQGNGMGDKPQSGWLIHLANRSEPLVVGSRRLFLHWSTFGGAPQPPMWIPVTDMNPPTKWWAVRLPNVFQLSRDAVQMAIDLAARDHSKATPLAGSESRTDGTALPPAGDGDRSEGSTSAGSKVQATEWRWVTDGFYRYGTKYPLTGQPLKLLKAFVSAGALGDGYVLTHQQINEACSDGTERAGAYVAELNKALRALWRLETKPVSAIYGKKAYRFVPPRVTNSIS